MVDLSCTVEKKAESFRACDKSPGALVPIRKDLPSTDVHGHKSYFLHRTTDVASITLEQCHHGFSSRPLLISSN